MSDRDLIAEAAMAGACMLACGLLAFVALVVSCVGGWR